MTEQKVEELILKYTEGTATKEEVQQLMDWYQSSAIEEVLWTSDNPKEKQHVHNRMLQRLHQETIPRRSTILRLSWLRVAALLVLVMGATFLVLWFSDPFGNSYITVVNPGGKLQLVCLPDSSCIWLNAATTLRYEKGFTKNRSLELEGEAYFEVTPDANHPFRVKAGGVQTTVVGTSFTIKAYEKDKTTTISVLKGSVKVANKADELAVVKPSMQLQVDRKYQHGQITKVDTTAVIAWKKGRLVFDGQALSDIVTTVERWYGVTLVFSDPRLGNCRYYMSFDNTVSLEKLLFTMAQIAQLQYIIDKKTNTITLSGKACP